MRIYVIKQMKDDKENYPTLSNVGFFVNLDVAKRIVEKNSLDLSEGGYYKYTTIMEFEEGLYNVALNELWYKWENNRYIECERPSNLKDFTFIV